MRPMVSGGKSNTFRRYIGAKMNMGEKTVQAIIMHTMATAMDRFRKSAGRTKGFSERNSITRKLVHPNTDMIKKENTGKDHQPQLELRLKAMSSAG
jgi:hypothetical protein